MAISEDLGLLIRENFVHNPTKEQEKVISLLSDFVLSRERDEVFLLKGGFAAIEVSELEKYMTEHLEEIKN